MNLQVGRRGDHKCKQNLSARTLDDRASLCFLECMYLFQESSDVLCHIEIRERIVLKIDPCLLKVFESGTEEICLDFQIDSTRIEI